MLSYAVIAHHTREQAAHTLADRLGAVMFVDGKRRGAFWNHRRALEWAVTQDHPVIVEDDAILCDSFEALAEEWATRFPNELLSFYLGRSRPPQYQAEIKTRLAEADADGTDWIELCQLIHGVAYTLPGALVPDVIGNLTNGPADFAIGRAWTAATGRHIIYPSVSLVDHDDVPSIEQHVDGIRARGTRRAWRFHG